MLHQKILNYKRKEKHLYIDQLFQGELFMNPFRKETLLVVQPLRKGWSASEVLKMNWNNINISYQLFYWNTKA